MALLVEKTTSGLEYKVKDMSQADFGRLEIEAEVEGDATLLIHEGVKAEELFEKNGTHLFSAINVNDSVTKSKVITKNIVFWSFSFRSVSFLD